VIGGVCKVTNSVAMLVDTRPNPPITDHRLPITLLLTRIKQLLLLLFSERFIPTVGDLIEDHVDFLLGGFVEVAGG